MPLQTRPDMSFGIRIASPEFSALPRSRRKIFGSPVDLISLQRQAGLVLAACALFWPAATAYAQEGALRFNRLTPEDGLSAPEVVSVAQDGSGFIWLATLESLDRFDGQTIKSYRADDETPYSLPRHSGHSLFTDATQDLWVATDDAGLHRYLPEHDGFEAFRADGTPNGPADDAVQALADAPSGNLWIATRAGLQMWQRFSETFTPAIPLDRGEDGAPRRVYSMLQARSGILWIGTHDGLFRLHSPESSVDPMPELSGSVVMQIVEGLDDDLWIARPDRLQRLSSDGVLLEELTQGSDLEKKLPLGPIYDLHRDRNGALWIAGVGGLSVYDPARNSLQHHFHDLTDAYSLSHSQALDVFEDRTGVLWIGTLDGASSWARGREAFVTYKRQQHEHVRQTLAANDVWSVIEDRQGYLWIGFGPFGLDRFDRRAGQVVHFRHDPADPGSLQDGNVGALLEDYQGRIWVGSGGGLSRLDPSHSRFQRFRHEIGDTSSLPSDTVYRLFEDSSRRLWVGTHNGLARLDRSTEPFTFPAVPLLTDGAAPSEGAPSTGITAFSFAEDDVGGLWVGTLEQGLFRLRSDDGQEALESLPSPSAAVLDLWWHSSGTLWAGTDTGLYQLDRHGRQLAHFDLAAGLPGSMIRGLLEDGRGALWLATNHGLSRFDPSTRTARNFDYRDGLQGNAFSSKAAYKSPSGELFFGGWRGLSAFYPDRVLDDTSPPEVALAELYLGDTARGPASRDPGSPLEVAIHQAEQLVLRHDQSTFGFEIAALHFAAPTKNRFQYRLRGMDSDWTNLDANRRFLSFSNLPPATYALEVRAANKDGVWTSAPHSLSITVLPPWWRHPAAYAAYILALLLAVGAWTRHHRLRLVEERQSVEVAQAAAEIERNVNERLRNLDKLKDEFLFKTSHELRTPLYGMTGLAESLLNEAETSLNEEQKVDLAMIVSSGYRLSRLINDILDFSKLQQENLKIKTHAVDLRLTVDTVLALITPMVTVKSLQLINDVPADLPPVDADNDRLQQILHNLIGNAVKFTEQGQVTVAAEAKGETVHIHVVDTGLGIAKEDQKRIFDAFEQVDSQLKRRFGGTGIGLAVTRQLVELHGGKIHVTSRPEEGSRFTFTLPVSHQKPAHLSDSSVDVRLSDFPESAWLALTALSTVGEEERPKIQVPPPGASELRGRSVLVVDDDPINRRILRSYLTTEKAVVTMASNGDSALKKAQELDFDLVLMDVMMPGMSGYEVCRELRKRSSLEELPILFLSALNQSNNVIEGLLHGGNDFLTKPISKNELVARVTPHLKLAKIYRGLEREVARKDSELKVLHGLLPICASCKKIRDDKGTWADVESYLDDHSEAKLSHSICPSCAHNIYPDLDLDGSLDP